MSVKTYNAIVYAALVFFDFEVQDFDPDNVISIPLQIICDYLWEMTLKSDKLIDYEDVEKVINKFPFEVSRHSHIADLAQILSEIIEYFKENSVYDIYADPKYVEGKTRRLKLIRKYIESLPDVLKIPIKAEFDSTKISITIKSQWNEFFKYLMNHVTNWFTYNHTVQILSNNSRRSVSTTVAVRKGNTLTKLPSEIWKQLSTADQQLYSDLYKAKASTSALPYSIANKVRNLVSGSSENLAQPRNNYSDSFKPSTSKQPILNSNYSSNKATSNLNYSSNNFPNKSVTVNNVSRENNKFTNSNSAVVQSKIPVKPNDKLPRFTQNKLLTMAIEDEVATPGSTNDLENENMHEVIDTVENVMNEDHVEDDGFEDCVDYEQNFYEEQEEEYNIYKLQLDKSDLFLGEVKSHFGVTKCIIDKISVPLTLDSGCKPVDIITLECVETLLPKYTSQIKKLPSPVVCTPAGPKIIIDSYIQLTIQIIGAGGIPVFLQITPRIINLPNTVMLFLGENTMISLGILNYPEAFSRLLGKSNSLSPINCKDTLNNDDMTNMTLHSENNFSSLENIFLETNKKISVDEKKLTKEETLMNELNLMLARGEICYNSLTAKNNLPFQNFVDLVMEYKDIFRIGFDASPPANFPPFTVRLKTDCNSIKAYPRPTPKEKADFLEDFVDTLLENDLVEIATRTNFTSNAFAVPKGPTYRLVIDYVRVNNLLEIANYPMPRLQECGERLAGSTIFGLFDMSNGYWQYEMDPEVRHLFTFITSSRAVTPKRMTMGINNAVSHIQKCNTTMLYEVRKNFELWLDDILQHAKTLKEYFNLLKVFFQIIRDYGIKLHPSKCNMLSSRITWLGREVSPQGFSFSDEQLSPLRNMGMPVTAADLQQFVCAAGWFRSSIPYFALIFQPLQSLLTKCSQKVGSLKKKKLASLPLTNLWMSEHDAAFDNAKNALTSNLTMSFLQEGGTVCVYCDSSSLGWSVWITQVLHWDNSLPVEKQKHRLLGVDSGVYVGSDMKADIVEKEAFAINKAIENFSHILGRPEGCTFFTDHLNLIFLLNPHSKSCSLHKNTELKIARWAASLIVLNFVIYHIKGDDNVWADILTRWGINRKNLPDSVEPNEVALSLLNVTKLSSLITKASTPQELEQYFSTQTNLYKKFHNMGNTTARVDFEYPTLEEIFVVQNTIVSRTPSVLNQISLDEIRKIYLYKDLIWIPSAKFAAFLRIRLCIIAHSSHSGHRNFKETLSNLTKTFTWMNMKKEIQDFCKSCHHCQLFNKNRFIYRPFGQTLLASKPNEILQFDFLFIHSGRYILLLMDKFSSFCLLRYCENADAPAVLDALLHWQAMFGIPQLWLTDQGSHFVNELLNSAKIFLGIDHYFTEVYTPWSNGSIERLNRTLLLILRKLCSENLLAYYDWPALLPIVNKVINESPNRTRANFSPRTLFTGLPVSSTIELMYSANTDKSLSLAKFPIDFMDHVETLQHNLNDLHSMSYDFQHAEYDRANNARETSDSRIQVAKFNEGDYVLIGIPEEISLNKLLPRWRGPMEIVSAVNPCIFEVKDLLTQNIETVHISRITKYYGSFNIDSPALKSHMIHDRDYLTYEKFKKLLLKKNKLYLQVKWLGFSDEETTEETIESCIAHNGDMVQNFIDSLDNNHPLKGKALQVLRNSNYRALY
jgi:transposase InsO family protein